MRLRIQEDLREAFEDLRASLLRIDGLHVEAKKEDLEDYKEESFPRLRQQFSLESLKDEPRIRAYRDFFWKVGIDPTKVRPASEALLRRVLRGRDIPRINTLVDSYNLASMESRIALAAFDLSTLRGDLLMRFAREGEEFVGIGMRDPISLSGREVVVEDDLGLVAVYPYRDAERTKVTLDTEDVVVMVCGVPGIDRGALDEAFDRSRELITRFCGGRPSRMV
jgi:DNA/RNA-binding domain of Phe-tRNA-synthetase-like protein